MDAVPVDMLLEVMSAVLERQVGPTDDFFAAGGDSLKASQLFSELEQRVGVFWPESLMLRASTAEDLAPLLVTGDQPHVFPIQVGGSLAPLIAIYGASGYVFGVKRLAETLGPDQPVYGLQAANPGAARRDPRQWSGATKLLRELAALHVGNNWSVFGMGIHGRLAHTMTLSLEAAGQHVRMLTLVDVRPLEEPPPAVCTPILALTTGAAVLQAGWAAATNSVCVTISLNARFGRALEEPAVRQVARSMVAASLRI